MNLLFLYILYLDAFFPSQNLAGLRSKLLHKAFPIDSGYPELPSSLDANHTTS